MILKLIVTTHFINRIKSTLYNISTLELESEKHEYIK